MRALWSLCRSNKPDCLFIMETKGGRDKFSKMGQKLGFQNADFVEAKGAAGGLAIFWLNDTDLVVRWKKTGYYAVR